MNTDNTEKLKRFLLQMLITREWSDEFNERELDGRFYWERVRDLGLIKPLYDDPKYWCEISMAGRKWLNQFKKGEKYE